MGPWLAVLGASPFLVGSIAGGGELVGYLVRFASGRLAYRLGSYWPMVYLGYAVNMLAVPLLALSTGLWSTSSLIFTERIGKGIRNPSEDALLAVASRELSSGRVFGIHELFDQTGGVLGPLLVAAVIAWSGNYRLGFAVLAIPALVALLFLTRSRSLEPKREEHVQMRAGRLPRPFLIYLGFMALTGLGFSHFLLVAYHLEKSHILSAAYIPLVYAVAMGVDGLGSLVLGRWFDRAGLLVLYLFPIASLLSLPVLFLVNTAWAAWLGMALWGIAKGFVESMTMAGVVRLVDEAQRGWAYGVADTTFGVAWWLGNAIMGGLYETNILFLVVVGAIFSLLAIPVLGLVRREYLKQGHGA